MMEFSGLVHECFETGQGIGLLLAVIGHIENGDIAVFFAISLKKRAHDRSGHTSERHDIDDAAGTALGEIDCLSNGQNCLPFEGSIDIGLCLPKDRFGFRLTEVSETSLEYLFQSVFILLLN